MMFSPYDPKTLEISPLGAAIVEALPDRKRVNAIKAEFKRSGKCPTSALFKTDDEVNGYYSANQEKGGA